MINPPHHPGPGLTIYHSHLSLPDRPSPANNTLAITNLNNLTRAKNKKTPAAAVEEQQAEPFDSSKNILPSFWDL